MRAPFDRQPPRPPGRRIAVRLMAAAMVALTSGCLQVEGLFGPIPQEQAQLQILRGMQHALSMSYNQPLSWMIKGIQEVLAMGLPTFYGTDLGPYLQTVPWPAMPSRDPNLAAPIYGDNTPESAQQANGEVYELESSDQLELMQFLFNPQNTQGQIPSQGSIACMPPGCKSLTYDVNLLRSRTGMTGSMQITTTTRTTWSKMSSPDPHQPFVFGDLWKTSQPDDVNATVNLNYEGQTGTISLSLSRSQTPTNSQTIQLQQVQINVDLPRISCNLSGKVSDGALAFSDGSLALTDDQGNSQELQITMLSLEGNSGELTMMDQQAMLAFDLSLDNGQLSGEVDSTNPNLSRSLAMINTTGNQTTVTYRDRGTPEVWN